MCFLPTSLYFLWRNVYSISLIFFFPLLSLGVIYLGYWPLTRYIIANIFFHSMGCLFTQLIVSFDTYLKFWSGLIYLFFILIFVSNSFGIITKVSLASPVSWNFASMFSCLYFCSPMVRCLIYFELIFLYVVKYKFNFILCVYVCISRFASTICWKECSFPI